ncbi:nuclear transport factor 2 family protein [Roseateles sp. GG27B]
MTFNVATALPSCLQLIHQLFYFLDESSDVDLLELFALDGIWLRQGKRLVGREQIKLALAERSTTQRIRHVISNGFIESQTQGLIQFVAYMTAYRFDDGVRHSGLLEISRPLRLSVVRAAIRQAEGDFEFEALSITPEFDFVSDALRCKAAA